MWRSSRLLLKAGADPNYLGTMEGQTNSSCTREAVGSSPQAALDLVSQVPPPTSRATSAPGVDWTTRRSSKSLKDPKAADRYRKVVES